MNNVHCDRQATVVYSLILTVCSCRCKITIHPTFSIWWDTPSTITITHFMHIFHKSINDQKYSQSQDNSKILMIVQQTNNCCKIIYYRLILITVSCDHYLSVSMSRNYFLAPAMCWCQQISVVRRCCLCLLLTWTESVLHHLYTHCTVYTLPVNHVIKPSNIL